MKNLTLIAAFSIASITIIACNNDNKQSNITTQDSSSKTTVKANTSSKDATFVDELVNKYLQVKNALASDDGKAAASASEALKATFEKTDKSAMTDKQKLSYDDIADDAKEMAEHISQNPDKLEHQREHFEMLSQDIVDLVKIFGTTQTLYVQQCPMYNKGAAWLSETEKIKNPFMGEKMLTCGSVKEELNPN
jgi:cell division protein FtsX